VASTSVEANKASAPPRGTRPRDRRAQIRAAATRLFYERGYEQVSVADIAESVNVGPSALYRHFSGKSEILFEAIDETATAFGSMLEDLPTRDRRGLALTCARTALAYRRLGVLWQREGRNLPAAQRLLLRGRLRVAGINLASTLGSIRPDLDQPQAEFLAACLVNAMSSISFHRLQLAPERYEEVLADLAERILGHDFELEPAPSSPQVRVVPEGRREEILQAATTLFARHGFEAVSIDDIGAAVGIAGPSIYNHFASKQELLYQALARGYSALQHSLLDAIEAADDPAGALRRVSDSYVDLTLDHSDVITTLIAEARNLDPEYGELTQRAQLGYIGQWVDLVQQLRPEEDITVSRIKVQSAQMMANSLGRTSYLRDLPGFRDDIGRICWILQQ
jgi:AcrR family transcriptional regulator